MNARRMDFLRINFLEEWLVENVTEAENYGSHERAKELAANLRADAKAQGVTLDDMEADSGSLEAIIYKTMHHGYDPVKPGFEVRYAKIKRQMNLLLEMLDDLKSYNTTILQWRDGRLVDVTHEWIDDLDNALDQWMLKLESELRENRQQGGELAG